MFGYELLNFRILAFFCIYLKQVLIALPFFYTNTFTLFYILTTLLGCAQTLRNRPVDSAWKQLVSVRQPKLKE